MSLSPERPNDPLAELPPVEPPTAGFVVQLFVIPAVVVAVVVAVWLLFGKLAGGERDVADYVRTIQSENENRRWRAAYELSSLIQNDPKLAADPALLGELTALLEADLSKPTEDDPDRKLAQYLVLALGAFQTTEARSTSGRPAEPLASLARALDPKQPTALRVYTALSLGRLGARASGSLKHEAASEALIGASRDPSEPELRQRAAYSLGYVAGPNVAEALRRAAAEDEDRIVRYNAAVALARRDDPAALPVLREMLSTADLTESVKSENLSETRSRVEAIQLEALWALQSSSKAQKSELSQSLRSTISDLARVGSPTVKVEAETLLNSLPTNR